MGAICAAAAAAAAGVEKKRRGSCGRAALTTAVYVVSREQGQHRGRALGRAKSEFGGSEGERRARGASEWEMQQAIFDRPAGMRATSECDPRRRKGLAVSPSRTQQGLHLAD